MRTKDEILEGARNDIQSDKFKEVAPLWIEYRKLEVLIDIRDLLQGVFNRLAAICERLQEKD